jgi:hypothetical protein
VAPRPITIRVLPTPREPSRAEVTHALGHVDVCSAEAFDLRFTLPDGSQWSNERLLLVSNNHNELDPRPMTGARQGIGRGVLGVVVVGVGAVPGNARVDNATFRIDSGAVVNLALMARPPPLTYR